MKGNMKGTMKCSYLRFKGFEAAALSGAGRVRK